MLDRNVLRSAVGAAGVATAVILAAGGGSASAEGSRAELDVRLSSSAPSSSTGLSFHVVYKNPNDPAAKPPALTSALFQLPAGLAIDGGAVTSCKASDDEFRARGRDACPKDSVVGTGTLTAITGTGPPADPFVGDITAFNGGDQLIEVVFVKDTNAVAGLDRLTIEGSSLRAHPPMTPGGPPDGRTAIREIRLNLPARLSKDGRRRLVTSPPDCPAAGLWTSRGIFGFNDGGAADVTSTTPCRQAAPKGSARTRVHVRPRRAVRGWAVPLRVRVSSPAAACARGAAVRVGSRRGRTDRRGQLRMRVRFGRSGRRQVLVKKRGCQTARGWVRVVRR